MQKHHSKHNTSARNVINDYPMEPPLDTFYFNTPARFVRATNEELFEYDLRAITYT